MQKIFLLFCVLIAGTCVMGQTLPPYTCGILYTYDNAGNRIKQEYYCRQARSTTTQNIQPGSVDSLVQDEKAVSSSFVKVDALYPNPTTGRFTIRFEEELKNGYITITDVNGKRLSQSKVNGVIIQLDISNRPPGTYFIIIRDGRKKITQKVIKQYPY